MSGRELSDWLFFFLSLFLSCFFFYLFTASSLTKCQAHITGRQRKGEPPVGISLYGRACVRMCGVEDEKDERRHGRQEDSGDK